MPRLSSKDNTEDLMLLAIAEHGAQDEPGYPIKLGVLFAALVADHYDHGQSDWRDDGGWLFAKGLLGLDVKRRLYLTPLGVEKVNELKAETR